MSLIAFHRVLITTAILFCGGFAVWEFLAFLDSGGWQKVLLALAFAAAAAGLVYYLRNLPRFLRLGEGGDSTRNPPP